MYLQIILSLELQLQVSRSGRLANMNSTRGSDGSWSRFNPRTPLVFDRNPEVLAALYDRQSKGLNRRILGVAIARGEESVRNDDEEMEEQARRAPKLDFPSSKGEVDGPTSGTMSTKIVPVEKAWISYLRLCGVCHHAISRARYRGASPLRLNANPSLILRGSIVGNFAGPIAFDRASRRMTFWEELRRV